MGAHRERESVTLVTRDSFDAAEERGVGGEGVVGLGDEALGVPGVPHALREVVGHFTTGEGVLEATAHDHGAGTAPPAPHLLSPASATDRRIRCETRVDRTPAGIPSVRR
jgi:hypothetical protein